jgi:hypothetical protein
MCSEYVHAEQCQGQNDDRSYGQRQKKPRERRLLGGNRLRFEGCRNLRGCELGRVDMSGRTVGSYEVGLFRPARRPCGRLRSVGPRVPPGLRRQQHLGREVLDYDGSRGRTLCFGWVHSRGRAARMRQRSGKRRPIQRTGIVRSCSRNASPTTRSSRSIHRALLRHRHRGGPTCAARSSARRRSDAIGGVGFGCRSRRASRRSGRCR